jgi:hypothetical protein
MFVGTNQVGASGSKPERVNAFQRPAARSYLIPKGCDRRRGPEGVDARQTRTSRAECTPGSDGSELTRYRDDDECGSGRALWIS